MSGHFKEVPITWGMVIDIDKCTGCGACMASCQTENNVEPQREASNKLRATSWMLVYELTNDKAFPNHDIAYLPRPCQQCGNPPCVSVCPVIATDKNENGGIVSQVYPRCIGCRYCVAACPYHVRYFGWYDPIWPEGMDKTLSPMTSVRPRGVVEKCTFCLQRSRAGKYSACLEVCPTGARIFGNLRDPNSEIRYVLDHKRVYILKEEVGTLPRFYYFFDQ